MMRGCFANPSGCWDHPLFSPKHTTRLLYVSVPHPHHRCEFITDDSAGAGQQIKQQAANNYSANRGRISEKM